MNGFAFSNFQDCVVILDGVPYPTVEHAYQAAKTLDPMVRTKIQLAFTPGTAKRMGNNRRLVELRPDWGETRAQEVMMDLLCQKFVQEPFRTKLMETRGPITEWNILHDQTWGSCTCRVHGDEPGLNQLGRLLMLIRDALLLGITPSSRLLAWQKHIGVERPA